MQYDFPDSDSDSDNVDIFDGGYSCKIITEFKKMETYRNDWDKLSKHPNSSWDYYYSLVVNNSLISNPYLVVIEKNFRVISLMAGYISKSNISILKIGYSPLIKVKIKKLYVPNGCIMGELDSTVVEKVMLQIEKSLVVYSIDVMDIRFININSNIYSWYKDNILKSSANDSHLTVRYYKTDLAVYGEQFTINLNKYKRRSRTPDKFNFKTVTTNCYKGKNQIEEFVKIANEISLKSLKHKIGQPFIYTPEKKVRYLESADKENLYLYVLKIEDKPCAFLSMYIYYDTCYFDQSGYSYAFKYCSPGSYLLINSLYDVLNFNLARYIDFDIGMSSFKSRLLKKEYKEVIDIMIFGNGYKPLLIKSAIGLLNFFKRVVNIFFKETGIQRGLKSIYNKNILKKLIKEEQKNS